MLVDVLHVITQLLLPSQTDLRLAPARATDYHGLPPTITLVGGSSRSETRR